MQHTYTHEHSFQLDWLAPVKAVAVAAFICFVIISTNLLYKTILWSSVNTINDVIEIDSVKVASVVTNPFSSTTEININPTYKINYAGTFTWMGREWCYNSDNTAWRRYATATNHEFKPQSGLYTRPWAFYSKTHGQVECVLVATLLFQPKEAPFVEPLVGKYITPSYNVGGPIKDPNPKIPYFPEDNVPVLFTPFKPLSTKK